MTDQQGAVETLNKLYGRTSAVSLRVHLGGIEDVGGVGMVVVSPVGNRSQGGTGGENLRRFKHRHERHEPPVGTTVNTDTLWVAVMLLHQPAHPVQKVLKFRGTHLSVNGGAPVPAIAPAGAVIHVQHMVAPGRQQVVEHLFPEVVGKFVVGILRITRAVNKNHNGSRTRGGTAGRVKLGPDGLLRPVMGRHRHDLRLLPGHGDISF